MTTDSEKSFSVTKPGTYTVHVKVTYPDGSYEDTNKFKITVLPSQAETIKVAPKASSFTVSSSSALEYHDDDLWDTLVDPSFFLTNASALPKGTVVRFNGSLDSRYTLDPGKYEDYLTVKFPDGVATTLTTSSLTSNKPNNPNNPVHFRTGLFLFHKSQRATFPPQIG